MGNPVTWIIEANLREGQEANMVELFREMSDATRENEPGCLIYEYYISDSGRELTLLERYADSEAVMVHMGTFGQRFAERFMGGLEVKRLTVLGNPSDEVRKVLGGLNPSYVPLSVGFDRA